MDLFAELDWVRVREHYDERERVHRKLIRAFKGQDLSAFARLLLGISDPAANYSASEHGLGAAVLSENRNAEKRVHALANAFLEMSSGRDVPPLVRSAALSYLKIGVGSEASAMLNPRRCWVTNVRSIWTHLLIKHDDDRHRASEELEYYRDGLPSEMEYELWTQIHLEMDTALTRVAERASRLASAEGVNPGPLKYLWADAVCNAVYTEFRV